MLLADGFEKAFSGICAASDRAIYDYEACVKVLVDRDSMSEEEATEFMEFNVVGAYVGPMTPIFKQKMTLEEYTEQAQLS